MLKVSRVISADFLAGGGEMGALTRSHRWAATPLGAPETWPQSLRTAVRLLLNSSHPMLLWWGPQLLQFYNDAYRQTMGSEFHPAALGQRCRECWNEIWDILGPQIEQVMRSGEGTRHENQLLPVTHDGKGLYAGMPAEFQAGRYHSLIAAPDRIPEALEVTARTAEGEIMGVRHKSLPIEGVQFHPESVLTPDGPTLMGNFLKT